MDSTWLQQRIDATKAHIEALEEAILALSSGTQQSYSLDTGQTKQTVTKKDLTSLQASIDALYSRLSALSARRNGGVVYSRPGW